CVQSSDLQQSVEQVLAQPRVERIILETTGLADPLPLSWRLQSEVLAPRVMIEAVVTVIDPTSAASYDAPEWEAQVSSADVHVVRKADVADGRAIAAVTERARAKNARARIVDSDTLASAFYDGVLDLEGTKAPMFAPPPRHSDWTGIVVVSTHE